MHPDVRHVSVRQRREIESKEWEKAVVLMLDKVGKDTYRIADFLMDYWR